MAAKATLASIAMKVRFNAGTSPDGNPIVKSKTVSGLNKAITDDGIMDAAAQVDKLYSWDKEGQQKVMTYEVGEA